MEDKVIRTRGTICFHKTGHYGGYTVQGFYYCNESQSIGWHIQSWSGGDPVNSFWIDESKFYALRIRTSHLYSNQVEIEILGSIEAPPKERDSILQAISEWNKEITDAVV